MWKKLKQVDYRCWICLALVLGSIALAVFFYEYPLIRIGEASDSLWRSVAYFLHQRANLFESFPEQTVNRYSGVSLSDAFGMDFFVIKEKLSSLGDEIFVGANFWAYCYFLVKSRCRVMLVLENGCNIR